MIAIITGDIINSREVEPLIWMPMLEKAMSKYSTKIDIYRGDSFQLEVRIEDVFEAIFYIKAAVKTIKNLDVRMAVGVGKDDFKNESIKKSNGEAFVFSGESFEQLKKETLAIKTPSVELNEMYKIILELTSLITNKWNVNSSKTVMAALEHSDLTQQELALILHKKHQSQLSTELTNAGFHKINNTIKFCTHKLLEYVGTTA